MVRTGRRTTETKSRILVAATQLFSAEGYVDTTMAAIAAEAGVSVQTLYLRYTSKAAILSAALDVAIAGDEEPVPVLERDWVRGAMNAPTGRAAITRLARGARNIADRTHQLYGVIQSAAADPEVGDVLAKSKRQRAIVTRTFAEQLVKKKGYNRRVPVERAGDVLYALMTEDSYLLFVVDRGWTPDEWETWSADTVTALLF